MGKVQICRPEFNPDGSEIEGNYTDLPDLNVSYVDVCSVPVTSSSQNTAVSGCNIDPFKQPNIPCDNHVEGPVSLGTVKSIANSLAPPFFAACKGCSSHLSK